MAAVNLVALGAGALAAPLVAHGGALAPVVDRLQPVGAVALAAGALLFWLAGDDEARSSLRPRAGARAAAERGGADRDARKEAAASAPRRAATASRDEGGSARQARERVVLAPREPFAAPARPAAWSREVLEIIEWRRFEALTEALFRQSGFETSSQSHGPDGGVDVRLRSPRAGERTVGLVQCKHWPQRRVGVDKVRELRGVMAAEGVTRGHFVASGGFTDEAASFAEANGIHLIDGERLLTLVGRRPAEQQARLLDVALEGEFWRPTCASCGIKLVERRGMDGADSFWGCVNYPRCRCTLPMRRR